VTAPERTDREGAVRARPGDAFTVDQIPPDRNGRGGYAIVRLATDTDPESVVARRNTYCAAWMALQSLAGGETIAAEE
jgi:hypothetical protein